MRVVILGSGATYGTIRECPTAEGFGRELTQRRPDWRETYPALCKAVDDLWPEKHPSRDDWNLADLWMRIDYYAKLSPALGASDYGGQASCELRKAVLDVYGEFARKRTAQMSKETRPFTLREILRELEEGDALVSFNWDVVAETILESLSRRSVQAPYPFGRGAIRLIKPHGSVSWRHRLGAGVEFQRSDGTPRSIPMSPDEVILGSVEPFILGAVPIKSELIREVQQRYGTNAYEVVVGQWRAFVEALRGADRVVVVGYRFPEEDGYGRFLVREALVGRGRGRPVTVQYYAKDGDCKGKLRSVLKEIFGLTDDPECLGPVAPPG